VDLERYWESRKRIIKDNGAVVLTASQPFTSMLVMSNLKMFRYEIIWNKTFGKEPFAAGRRPMKAHENILIFYLIASTFNPQYEKGKPYKDIRLNYKIKTQRYRIKYIGYINNGYRNPISVINLKNPNFKNMHPTQKPVTLFEYLIKTYTNEGDLVWDGFAGSGTTGVACINTNRRFICVEKEQEYFEKAEARINEARKQVRLAV
jgi:site-specific DNA-methyltransferase (adenine-specific)